ncbi:dihydropteroate synthase [Variibacter gotjawalensis]|nr:dihydropteroate synthase [Variibacter gotjawalensis]
MGVVNVTPDSFSDGGQFLDPEIAIAHAEKLVADGADILDIGGESTRPYGGMQPVDADEEWRRIAPVVAGALPFGATISVDTMKASVAAKAVAAGASIINDVWGLQRDPGMARVAADHDVGVVAMHNRDAADPAIDIMADIRDFFARTLAIADKARIPRHRIILDPGIGFGKTPEQSLTVIARTAELTGLGAPLLVGLSRKRFIASVDPSEPHQRLGGSLAANLYAAKAGAAVVRVHDVRETRQALKIAAAIETKRK